VSSLSHEQKKVVLCVVQSIQLHMRRTSSRIRRWVEKGKAWAQNMLGQRYEVGLGVDQSYQQARELYELAACQGNAISQFRLGIMYQHGQGVDQSNEQAKEYYEAAARQGLDFAQFNLGALSLCKWSRCRAIH